MSYNYSTTTCMPPPSSPIVSYDQASTTQSAGGGRGARTPDPHFNVSASGNSYYVNHPTSSPHWVSPIPSIGNPFSFDSHYSHSSYVSGYASPVSPNTYDALKYPEEESHPTIESVHLKRENCVNSKALSVQEETVGVEVSCTAAPVDFDTRRNEELDYDVMSDPGTRKREHHDRRKETAATSKDDANDVKCAKNGFDMVRERGANLKALALLEQTVGYDLSDVAKATSIYLHKPTLTLKEESYSVRQQLKANYKIKKMSQRSVEEQRMLKEDALFESRNNASDGTGGLNEEETTSKHTRAKMIAEYKAKKKLEKYVHITSGISATESCHPTPTSTANDTTYNYSEPVETAAMRYNNNDETKTDSNEKSIGSSSSGGVVATVPDEELNSKQIRAKIVAEYKAKKKLNQTVGYTIAAPESLAESSRNTTNAAVDTTNHDPETVAGMKCEMDLEREHYAKKKALQLLNDRPGLMA